MQLNFSMPDRVKECWCKSSSQHWGKPELIGQLALNNLWETPCAEPHAGCCGGWGLETPGYPIDIDDFKVINDTLGSAVGDELLCQVASRLSDCVRGEDTVARMGGDEYAILLENVKNLDHVKTVSEKIQTMSSGQFDISDHKQHLSMCVGSSVFPVDTEDPDTLIRQAHAAMFHAKEGGRGMIRSYIEDMSLRFSLRLQLENRLRKAVENEEFVLHYQPQVNLHDNRIIGVEALLRWQSPERGLVYPVEFVSTLEEMGLIVSVGRWVLHTACSQNKRWQDAGLGHITMAVNVSPIQFSSHQMTDTIIEVLAKTGLPPCSLELEITENALMNHPAHCAFVLRELKVLGVNTSIDDFGTGYSSFSYLKRFPISKLKIDRSFITDLPHDENDASITKAILGLGNSLQLDVLAEGVETKAQLKFLKKHGCEEVQGYYFSRPIPADELTILLEEQSSERAVI
ncbi:MAG: bifunctional diguanylate cyclase/phosphodiesterase [Candidatus Sedimenticola sp. (ex Thyasira tokunagai)]